MAFLPKAGEKKENDYLYEKSGDEDDHGENHENFKGNIFEKMRHLKLEHAKLDIEYAEDGFPKTNG